MYFKLDIEDMESSKQFTLYIAHFNLKRFQVQTKKFFIFGGMRWDRRVAGTNEPQYIWHPLSVDFGANLISFFLIFVTLSCPYLFKLAFKRF